MIAGADATNSLRCTNAGGTGPTHAVGAPDHVCSVSKQKADETKPINAKRITAPQDLWNMHAAAWRNLVF